MFALLSVTTCSYMFICNFCYFQLSIEGRAVVLILSFLGHCLSVTLPANPMKIDRNEVSIDRLMRSMVF